MLSAVPALLSCPAPALMLARAPTAMPGRRQLRTRTRMRSTADTGADLHPQAGRHTSLPALYPGDARSTDPRSTATPTEMNPGYDKGPAQKPGPVVDITRRVGLCRHFWMRRSSFQPARLSTCHAHGSHQRGRVSAQEAPTRSSDPSPVSAIASASGPVVAEPVLASTAQTTAVTTMANTDVAPTTSS